MVQRWGKRWEASSERSRQLVRETETGQQRHQGFPPARAVRGGRAIGLSVGTGVRSRTAGERKQKRKL